MGSGCRCVYVCLCTLRGCMIRYEHAERRDSRTHLELKSQAAERDPGRLVPSSRTHTCTKHESSTCMREQHLYASNSLLDAQQARLANLCARVLARSCASGDPMDSSGWRHASLPFCTALQQAQRCVRCLECLQSSSLESRHRLTLNCPALTTHAHLTLARSCFHNIA